MREWLRRKMSGSCWGAAWFFGGSFWSSAFHHYDKSGIGADAAINMGISLMLIGVAMYGVSQSRITAR